MRTAFVPMLLVLSATVNADSLTKSEMKKLHTFVNHCSVEGKVSASHPDADAKKASNRLKNRDIEPTQVVTLKIEDLVAFDGAGVGASSEQEKADLKAGTLQKAVMVEAYVVNAAPGGCAKRKPPDSSGESCNCNSTDKLICDTHLTLAPAQGDAGDQTRHVIAEITPRLRLKNGTTKNWKTTAITKNFKGRVVHVTGWLFYDPDHECGAQATRRAINPGCKGRDQSVWRATVWEIHPITSIELVP